MSLHVELTTRLVEVSRTSTDVKLQSSPSNDCGCAEEVLISTNPLGETLLVVCFFGTTYVYVLGFVSDDTGLASESGHFTWCNSLLTFHVPRAQGSFDKTAKVPSLRRGF